MSEETGQSQKPVATGHGHPPNGSRFKPGRSGNPKGRPKGAKNISTIWENELNAPMVVTEGGKRKKIKKAEAVVKRVINKGVEGDLKAASLVLSEQRTREERAAARPGEDALQSPADQLVIGNIIARIRAVLIEESGTSFSSSDISLPSSERQGDGATVIACEPGQGASVIGPTAASDNPAENV